MTDHIMLSTNLATSALIAPGLSTARSVPSRSLGSPLWDIAGRAPSLDLNLAQNKNLLDSVTGQSLVTFTRASTGTYVGADGLIKTAAVNEARFDHNPTTGESLGLLVEEQRTNLLLRSEEFDNASWTGSESNTTVTANSTVAPDGSLAADTIDFTNASAYRYQTISGLTAGTSYTFSVWLASGTKTQAVIRITGTSTGTGGQAVVSLTSVLTRYSVTVTLPAGNTAAFVGFENRTAVGGGNGGTGTVIAWGAQLEVGAFPTSYIPTTTSAATRSADVASISGSNFSSWYRQDEGTVFASAQRLTNGTDYNRLLSFNNNASSNVWSIYCSANKYDGYKKVGGGADNFYDGPTVGTLLSNHRVAAATNSSGLIMAADGTLGSESAFTGMPTVDRLAIGSEYYLSPFNGAIRRLTYWPARLANSTLQSITA